MKMTRMNSGTDPADEVSSVKGLLDLYNRTMDALQKCADIDPAQDNDMVASDRREMALLDIEADLLRKAARIQINSDSDVQTLMDIWSKVSGYELGIHVTPSDRIAMNIFRHLSRSKAFKA